MPERFNSPDSVLDLRNTLIGRNIHLCWGDAIAYRQLFHCPQCSGALKIIAAIEEPAVITRILTHLGLPARAPPRSPARSMTLFQAA